MVVSIELQKKIKNKLLEDCESVEESIKVASEELNVRKQFVQASISPYFMVLIV